MAEIHINLTDEEWMSVIDMERDGLPYCCGNISALRDRLISIARYGCRIEWESGDLIRKLLWVEQGHDLANLPVIQKIKDMLLADPDNAKRYERLSKVDHDAVELREPEGFG